MVNYADWVGRQQTVVERISPALVSRMAALMNSDASLLEGDKLPACWHWLFFNPLANQDLLGPDGHAPRGDFMPPVLLPRRMFAGARLDWHSDFKVGESIERESTIASVETKAGQSGFMVFVRVRHAYRAEGAVRLEEEQDIVYRADSTQQECDAMRALAQQVNTQQNADFRFARPARHTQAVRADPIQLFRYSAVTFNGHRIHYDRPYAMEVENYPGLVVHGPLIATMLVAFSHHTVGKGRMLRHYEFRAKKPTFDIGPFHLHVSPPDPDGRIALWSSDNVGQVAVDGWAVYG